MRIVIRQQMHRAGVGIWLVRHEGNQYRIGKPTEIQFGENTDGSFLLPEPTFQLSTFDFQELVASTSEEMIGAGFAPSAVANASELKATKSHLEDMRTLVFKSRGLKT